MEAYTYSLDRKENIVSSSRVNHLKLSDLVKSKQEDAQGTIAFVSNIESDVRSAVETLLASSNLALYATKKPEVWVVGNVRKPKVICVVE